MTTQETPTKHENKSEEMPGFDDDDIVWCIMTDNDSQTALCGETDFDVGPVPNDEVPDEQTCPECLRIEKLIDAAIEREGSE